MRINSKDAPPSDLMTENGTGVAVAEAPADDHTNAPTIESVADLVARKKQKPQRVYLESLGEYAWFMPLNALDQRELNRMQVKKVKKIDEITGKEEDAWDFDPVGLPLAKVALAWTNQKGDRMRGNAAIEAIGQLDPAVIAEANAFVDKITNWVLAEKNSDASRGGGSSSSSR